MGSQHDDRDHAANARPSHEQPDPANGRKPVYFRPNPHFGQHTLRERALGVAWPLDTAEYEEVVARQNLEQVGRILARLELDRAEILELRTETRAILAGLAA